MDKSFEFVNKLQNEIVLASDSTQIEPMKRYMQNLFDFHGIKSPQRKGITSKYNSEFKSFIPEIQMGIIDTLWKMNERECQYAALDFATKIEKRMQNDWLQFWINKIQEKSWWDTVDHIASHFVGQLLLNHKEKEKYAWLWTESENMWLQRTAIIFQLKYKTKTNADLMFDIILAQAGNKEFFIRKACGWALREYSRSNPLAVSEFINLNRDILSALTIKEGERLMKK
jgi:3-methyladenine DNA glycosylase AlkD